MKVVSETTPEDREAARKAAAKEDAADGFVYALRSLTSNLMRITRGAGKSYEVGGQIVDLHKALEAYWDAFGHWPAEWDYRAALSLRTERDETYTAAQIRRDAIMQMVRGSLQISASRLVDQPTHEHRGEDELMDGVRSLDDWREALREELGDGRRRKPRPPVIKL